MMSTRSAGGVRQAPSGGQLEGYTGLHVWRIIDPFSRESKRLRPCLLHCKLTSMALPPRILI